MSENKTFTLNLLARPFDAIKKGTKTVEVRANKNQTSNDSVNKMRSGDTIIFHKIGTNEELMCMITRITLYQTVKDLLMQEDINQTLSSGRNLEEGIKSIESISDYKEQIAKNGVFAIVVHVL